MTTHTIQERFRGHVRHSANPKFRLHYAIKKYGEQSFIIEKLDEADNQENANQLESFWIKSLNSTSYECGYNMANGGSGKSLIVSEEIRQKIKYSVKPHRNSLTSEEKKNLTKSANEAKRGMIESDLSKERKSMAQRKRWQTANEYEKKEHGKKSKNGVSIEGKMRALECPQKFF
jgi:group I intron endonuclease